MAAKYPLKKGQKSKWAPICAVANWGLDMAATKSQLKFFLTKDRLFWVAQKEPSTMLQIFCRQKFGGLWLGRPKMAGKRPKMAGKIYQGQQGGRTCQCQNLVSLGIRKLTKLDPCGGGKGGLVSKLWATLNKVVSRRLSKLNLFSYAHSFLTAIWDDWRLVNKGPEVVWLRAY